MVEQITAGYAGYSREISLGAEPELTLNPVRLFA